MIQHKNKLMLWISLAINILSLIIHLIHREYQLIPGMRDMSMNDGHSSIEVSSLALNVIFVIPIIFLIIAVYLFMKKKDHLFIPHLLMLSLTFSSMSIIAGSGGSVEFHFSIFMVIAILAYYANINLILISTVLFAIQHAAGYLVIPEYVFGASFYSLTMVLIHAIFLILTSLVTSMQIHSKAKITKALEEEKGKQQSDLLDVLSSVKNLSHELDKTSVVVSGKSEENMRTNKEMMLSFQEVSKGLDVQSQSVNSIETNLQAINKKIQQTSRSSTEITERASDTEHILMKSVAHIRSLFEQIVLVSSTIETAMRTITSLNTATNQVEMILASIKAITSQTNILSLNAGIEAARAGEQGKGFSIVASEIRKLADQSNIATEAISNILTTIREESASSFAQIELGKQASALSLARANETISGFDSVDNAIKQMIQSMNQFNASIIEIETGSEGISLEVNHILSIIQQSVPSVEQLFTISETQLEASKQVDQEIAQLKQISHSIYKQFTS
ncbi:methyl-accepting chemotaxis protein [Paenibacillus agricola]|uniref:Methyl-accepting transducer domain-containing protein n=1 Tax=Paenibacillus agricola TaxID=2716264 RepID=A0ABX0J2V9_9BACL|nr:methyl-accepting chemotaxis protein [Paenibacillus agricola]NHN29988.1 hypothetical protein [Paenibacillus agricola]